MHHNFFSLNFPRCCWNTFYLILNSCINTVYWKCAVFLAHRVYGAASYHLTASSVTSVHTYQRSCLTPLPPVSCNWRQHNYWYSDNIPTTFVLWHCWLGVRKSIRSVKIEWWDVGVVSVCSEVQIVCICSSWCHCFPKPYHPLLHLNPDWFYISDTGLPGCPEKRPLNGCSSSSLTTLSYFT